jgi:serine/threonine protein kinase
MTDSEQLRQSAGEANLRYPLPTGTRVDHYIVREVLGAGGFGITYLAEHEALGKQYAIKEYFPNAYSYRQGRTVRPTSTNEGTYKWGLERFVSEARSLAKFKHPAIVDVTSIFEANGTAYIVLGYEPGLDLGNWLKQLGRPPTQEELDRLLTPLLSALDEVHRHHMMHRDISPDNLLIRDDGRPVLIDFGSARESIRGRARALSAIVKHGYSPPEQYTSRPELQGPWTDIYALSATLYRAISGKLPAEATERLLRDDLVPLSRLARAAYRPGFLDAIGRGLRMQVEERPQSIVEWREQLFRPEPLRQPVETLPASSSTEQRGIPDAPVRASAVKAGVSRNLPPAASAVPPRPTRSAPGLPPSRRSAPAASGNSQRVSGGSSIPKSERPDLSWLDEADDLALADQTTSQPRANIGETITYAFMGLFGGGILGAMISIVLASIVSTQCFADSCIYRYTALAASIGAAAGIFVALRLIRQPTSGDAPAADPPVT